VPWVRGGPFPRWAVVIEPDRANYVATVVTTRVDLVRRQRRIPARLHLRPTSNRRLLSLAAYEFARKRPGNEWFP